MLTLEFLLFESFDEEMIDSAVALIEGRPVEVGDEGEETFSLFLRTEKIGN